MRTHGELVLTYELAIGTYRNVCDHRIGSQIGKQGHSSLGYGLGDRGRAGNLTWERGNGALETDVGQWAMRS